MTPSGKMPSRFGSLETDSDLHLKIFAQSSIVGARKTLALAKTRCLPFKEKLRRLKRGLDEESFDELAYAVGESARSARQNADLASVVADLAKKSDHLRTSERTRLDRRVGKLLRVLPFELARPVLVDFLSDPLKQRRQIALKCIRSEVMDDHLVRVLWNRFLETEDNTLLKVILGKPISIALLDPRRMIRSFDDDYWKMRVIEATLKTDVSRGTEFGSLYPRPFIWACGRLGNRGMISKVFDCLSNAHDKVALIDITAWAFGKLGATAELNKLEALLNELSEQFAAAPDRRHPAEGPEQRGAGLNPRT
jgi:hypothetical protein